MNYIEILDEIEKHRNYLKSSVELQSELKYEKARNDLCEMIKDKIVKEILDDIIESGEFEESIKAIVDGKIDPYTACDTIVLKKLK